MLLFNNNNKIPSQFSHYISEEGCDVQTHSDVATVY